MSRREVVWNLRVPAHLDEMLERYIKLDAYKTKSEFIRTAVREKLREEFERLKKTKKEFLEEKK